MDFNSLKNSILFNISLQSKELFHSNFLEYLFRKYPDIFFKIIEEKQLKITDIKREVNNTDILILGEKKYIIENKIKDVAKIDQLNDYSKNNETIDGFYLFSLLGNNIQTKECIWKEIGYKKIINILECYNFNNDYLSLIVKDYCSFVSILINSLDIYNNCSKYIFYSSGNELYNKFKEIRMHDLFLKYGMSLFLQYFNENFNKNNIINTNYGINNSRPTMDFLIRKNDLNVLIQIEDLEYRYAVVCKENQLEYFERIGWFNPKWQSKRGLNYRSYNDKYGKKFYYQFELLKRNEDFNILSEKIINDIMKIMNI